MERKISYTLLLGFAMSSVGGPLALAAVYLNFGASTFPQWAVVLTGFFVFLFPMYIWYRYSESISSPGGMYEFVYRAAGKKAAKLQGWAWAFSYFLYLPYTMSYILFYLLPSIFNLPTIYLYLLGILLPAMICFLMLLDKRVSLSVLTIGAAIQLLFVVGMVFYIHAPSAMHYMWNAMPAKSISASFSFSLLLVCSSLPLYLGGEAKDARKRIGPSIVISVATVSMLLAIWAAVHPSVPASPGSYSAYQSGFALSMKYAPAAFSNALGIFIIVSIVSLVIAEFFALSRLLHSMLGISVRKSTGWISLFFMFFASISLIDPRGFYNITLYPSLIALYLSLLIPVLAYPFFRRKLRLLSLLDMIAVIISAALFIYGILLL